MMVFSYLKSTGIQEKETEYCCHYHCPVDNSEIRGGYIILCIRENNIENILESVIYYYTSKPKVLWYEISTNEHKLTRPVFL